MSLHLQPVQVGTGSHDTESQLVFADRFLVAVLVHLADEHGADEGNWFLEAGFGRVDHPNPPKFTDLDGAQAWCNSLGGMVRPRPGRDASTRFDARQAWVLSCQAVAAFAR